MIIRKQVKQMKIAASGVHRILVRGGERFRVRVLAVPQPGGPQYRLKILKKLTKTQNKIAILKINFNVFGDDGIGIPTAVDYF